MAVLDCRVEIFISYSENVQPRPIKSQALEHWTLLFGTKKDIISDSLILQYFHQFSADISLFKNVRDACKNLSPLFEPLTVSIPAAVAGVWFIAFTLARNHIVRNAEPAEITKYYNGLLPHQYFYRFSWRIEYHQNILFWIIYVWHLNIDGQKKEGNGGEAWTHQITENKYKSYLLSRECEFEVRKGCNSSIFTNPKANFRLFFRAFS